MRKSLKKPVSLALALILLLALLPVWAITPAAAAGNTEKESNDTLSTANAIAVNTQITGNLMKSSDEDWFSFTLSKDGYISLTFGHESQIVGSSNYWATAFYTSDNSIIDAWTNWEGNTTVDGSTYKIGLPAGTYYLCVDKASSYSDQTYHFTVNFKSGITIDIEA